MNTNIALIIDDNATIRELLRQTLKLLGFQHIHDAANGLTGIQLAQQQPFDVIFLDLELPDLHGTSVLNHLKPSLPDTPVIVVTAHTTVENLKLSLAAGASGFIAKPFSAQKISAILHKNHAQPGSARSVSP